MSLKSDAQHWGGAAKFFHWIIALLIVGMGILGLIMVELPKKPNVIPVYTMHKSFGLTVLTLVALRLAWRAFDPHPREPDSMPRWQALGARAGHALLYVLMFAVPLSGWLFDSASALRPLYWFNLIPIPSLTGGPDSGLKELTHIMHETLFWLLIVVAAGHAAMAVVHQYVQHDGILARMLPGRRR
jgi:cytochrome b561